MCVEAAIKSLKLQLSLLGFKNSHQTKVFEHTQYGIGVHFHRKRVLVSDWGDPKQMDRFQSHECTKVIEKVLEFYNYRKSQ